MANEITINQITATFEPPGTDYRYVFRPTGMQKIATKASKPRVQDVVIKATRTSTVIALGSVAVPGWIGVFNEDDTHAVYIQPSDGGAKMIKVEPKEAQLFRCGVTAPYIVSDGEDVSVRLWIVED